MISRALTDAAPQYKNLVGVRPEKAGACFGRVERAERVREVPGYVSVNGLIGGTLGPGSNAPSVHARRRNAASGAST